MRLPYSRIYRAFPELDRFSDEQCLRFVRAACKSGWQRHMHRAFLTLFFFATLLGCAWGAPSVIDPLERFGRQIWRPMPPVLSLAPALFLAFLAPSVCTFFLRDFFLLRRIRHVLRSRGVCPACRYSLVGLPVSFANIVTCPECGCESDVDPSLSELTIDHTGERRVTPGVVPEPPRFWTPRRIRHAKRLGLGAAILLFVVFPLCWGGYELFLARQAATARRERPGVSGVMSHIEAHQPPGTSPGDPDAWDAFFRAAARRAEIDASIAPAEPQYAGNGQLIAPDFSLLGDNWREGADPEELEYLAACEAEAARHVAAYEETGLFDDLREIGNRRRAVRELELAPGAPVIEALLPELGESRQLARILAARMRAARIAGDFPVFAQAFETALALARINRQQPFAIQNLVGVAIEVMSLAEARALLAQSPPAEALDAIETALARQKLSVPADYHLQGERLMVLDTIAWFFGRPSNVRFGRFSRPKVPFLFGPYTIDGPIGTYGANRRAVEAHFAAARAGAGLAPHQRGSAPALPPAPKLALPQMLLTSPVPIARAQDKLALDRSALTVLIALERHRLAHGAYPARLSDLTPPLDAELLLDPYSGEPLVYLPGGAPANNTGRAFLLYSVGFDGTDNRGAEHPDGAAAALRPGGEGYDYPLRDPVSLPPRD